MKTYKKEQAQAKAKRHATIFWMLVTFIAYTSCIYQIMSGKVIG